MVLIAVAEYGVNSELVTCNLEYEKEIDQTRVRVVDVHVSVNERGAF